MATKIETLKKPNGDQVLPRTHAKAVSMENGMTVDVAIEDITEQLKTCPDANSVVLHTQQELTETQKSQARTNIGITEWLTSEDVVADSPTPIDADTLGGRAPGEFMPAIKVTTADNGKFLRVVNGAWAVASLDRAEEVDF